MLASVALACLVSASCQRGPKSAPPPTKAALITALQEQVTARAEAIRAKPESAAAEVGLLVESVESLAQKLGAPFDGFLAEVKAVKASLDGKPSSKAVKEAADLIEQKAKALQP